MNQRGRSSHGDEVGVGESQEETHAIAAPYTTLRTAAQKRLVRPEGLAPPTLGSEGQRSTLEIDSDQGGQIDMFSL